MHRQAQFVECKMDFAETHFFYYSNYGTENNCLVIVSVTELRDPAVTYKKLKADQPLQSYKSISNNIIPFPLRFKLTRAISVFHAGKSQLIVHWNTTD